jgi:SAM-dependent methyltransferase
MKTSIALRSTAKQLRLSLPHPEPQFDPWGEQYCADVSPQDRRVNGVTLTPEWLVQWMIERAGAVFGRTDKIGRVVDAGCGTARFALRSAAQWPRASVIGVEADRELAGLASRAIGQAGVSRRIDIRVEDYRYTSLTDSALPTVFIGNPPYVRHHDLDGETKAWYASGMAALGIRAGALAGLHAHFLLRTAQLARAGDVFCFVLPAEWMDTRYGHAVRQLLATKLCVTQMWLADKTEPVFADAMVTSVVVLGRFGDADRDITIGQLHQHAGRVLRTVTRDMLCRAERWSTLWHEPVAVQNGSAVGDLFVVRRGQVTGNNALWTYGARFDGPLPDAVLVPTVTRARELLDLRTERLRSSSDLKRVIDIPADWESCLVADGGPQIRRFIDWAKRCGGMDSYIARHRSPWYCVRLPPPAPILMTYMARRPPRFVLNEARAAILNIAHGLYPRQPLTRRHLVAAVSALNRASNVRDGRAYSGNLIKFEPGEAMRMRFDWMPEQ